MAICSKFSTISLERWLLISVSSMFTVSRLVTLSFMWLILKKVLFNFQNILNPSRLNTKMPHYFFLGSKGSVLRSISLYRPLLCNLNPNKLKLQSDPLVNLKPLKIILNILINNPSNLSLKGPRIFNFLIKSNIWESL